MAQIKYNVGIYMKACNPYTKNYVLYIAQQQQQFIIHNDMFIVIVSSPDDRFNNVHIILYSQYTVYSDM